MKVYRRLTDLITLLCDETFQATTENLAGAVGVSERQIEEDIDYLMKYKTAKGKQLFASHITITKTDSGDCYQMDPEAFGEGYKLLRLTPYEFKYFKALDYHRYEVESYLSEEEELFASMLDIRIEGFEHIFYPEVVTGMEKAIDAGATISMKRVLNGKIKNVPFIPHFIKRDVNENELYVIQVDEDGYISAVPFYNICSYEIESKDGRKDFSDEIRARVDSVWSFDIDTLDDIFKNNEEPTHINEDTLDDIAKKEPMHIKLMIFDEDDMIERIKTDTFGRKRGSLTGPCSYGEDTVYYYEDDVLGLKPFKEWVKEFGESVIVLEPKELAYEIYRENCIG